MANPVISTLFALLLANGGELKPVPRAEDAGDIKIHFHAFQYDPFAGTTIEDVVPAICVFEFAQNSREARRLRSIVFGAQYGEKGEFDYRQVRVKMENITFGNLYLDKHGNILSAAKWIIGQFGNEEFAEIKTMLTQEARENCEVYKGLEIQ